MLHFKNIILTIILTCVFAVSKSQQIGINYGYLNSLSPDSLVGFDEEAARRSAISEQFYGSELKIKMYLLKREFINNKYNLVRTRPISTLTDHLINSRPGAIPGCVNEDFEASTAGVITASNQINGWTVTGGYNGDIPSTSPTPSVLTYIPNQTGVTTCNLLGCCPMPPSHSALIDCSAPGGFIDNQIGAQYPIFSVFGSGSANANAAATNPQINQPLFGSKVLRLNDGIIGDYSIEKLSKTFAVTAQNALFQFAFISVFSPGHSCCDAGAFQIRLTNATANTVIPCPSFSVSAPSAQCTNTAPITYLNVGTGTTYSPGVNFSNIYHPWKINSIDMTPYIGQNITIDIIATDCIAGGHYGKVYFDAQCGPMIVTGNGTPYAADVANVIVPTCGAAGATICAAAGLGPYSWAGPNVTPNQSIPSYSNQCMTATVSATYTLYMQPQGSCFPIQRLITSTITPAPLLNASVVQAQCGSTLALVSVTPSGSAANPSTLSWSPSPLSINSTSTQGNYQIPVGPASQIVSVTASDPLGCLITATASVDPAPPYPTFTINNVTGSSSITCAHPVINLDAQTNYNYNNGTLNYFWASNSTTFSASNVNITNPGSYTVNAVDPVTNCGATKVVSIGVNTVAPVSVLSPSTQLINCNLTSISNVTVHGTPTLNITHVITSPQGGVVTANSYSLPYTPGGIGTYTHCLTDDINGCSTCKQFTVSSNLGFPTYSLVSPSNFSLGCGTKSVATINITGASATSGPNQIPNGGPVSYTLIGPPTSSVVPTGTLGIASTYTVNTPGTWTVIVKDNVNLCESRTPVSILQNTFAPQVSVLVKNPVLDCNTPRTTLKASSLTNNVNYVWSFPGLPGTQPGDSIVVSVNSLAPTSSVIANFTINVQDNSNTCKTTSIIPMHQNLYPPKASVTNGGNNNISCKTASVVLTNQSTSSIPAATGFNTGQPVVGFLWQGPSPQVEKSNATTYLALTPGVYTMTAKDLNNGCISYTTVAITDKRNYPSVNNPVQPPPAVLDCAAKNTKLTPIITTPTTGLTYTWSAPGSASVTNQFSMTLTTNAIGEYHLLVFDPSNGCLSEAIMQVINGSLTASFEPDRVSGTAPLFVSFQNTSKSSQDNTGISSIWNFGNGTSKSVGSLSDGAALYTQPGTYTVTLFANKGNCAASTQKIISVEIPSRMSVPNVFSPNNDNINDVFFLAADNLTEINASIFDRWGHVVYQVASTSGNIAWDGKNQAGVEVAEGTYFYSISGKGKDGQGFNKNGTITLVR